jgi:RNA polymerase sigma factor (sigma-70 family)
MSDDFVEAGYLRDIARASLTKAERRTCVEALYYDTGPNWSVPQRTMTRNRLASAMQPLVRRCAKQLLRQGRVLDADFADLIQAGNIGLLQGLATWKPEGGAKLASWCAWSIKREMTRENDRAVVVPHAAFSYVESYSDESVGEVEEGPDESYGNDYAVTADFDPEPEVMLWQGEGALADIWNDKLTSSEAWVLEFLYWQDMSTREAAAEMKISHAQVAILHRRALEKYRAEFTVRNVSGNYTL